MHTKQVSFCARPSPIPGNCSCPAIPDVAISCLLMRCQRSYKSFCKTFKLHTANTNQPNLKGHLFIILNLTSLQFHWSRDITTSWSFTGASVIADKLAVIADKLDTEFHIDKLYIWRHSFFSNEHLQIKNPLHLPLKWHTWSPITLQLQAFRCHSLSDFPTDTAVS